MVSGVYHAAGVGRWLAEVEDLRFMSPASNPHSFAVRQPATSSSNSFDAWDLIQGQLLSGLPSPIPTPVAPCDPSFCTTKVQYWAQNWYVGSTNPGSGIEVQTDNILKYTDHAEHLNVVSPP